MAIDATYYGDLGEAEDYFAGRLHSQAWNDADDADKPKALLAARRLIDNLNFKGRQAFGLGLSPTNAAALA